MVKVDFSKIEGPQQLPKGPYHFRITDGEVKETGDHTDHPGSDFWGIELTVQDGENEGRTQSMSVMLPPYEPFTLAAIMRATVGQHEYTEKQVDDGEIDVELDDLMDLEFVANVRPQKKNDEYNEVRRIRPYDKDKWTPDGGKKKKGLLP